MKILRFLQNFVKISRIFRENLSTNQNYAVVGGSGGRAPAKLAILLKKSKKAMETVFFEIFPKLSKKIWVSEANLNKI